MKAILLVLSFEFILVGNRSCHYGDGTNDEVNSSKQ